MNAIKYDEYVPCLYRTHKDLADRLDGTICRYKGEPVYISVDDDTLNLWKVSGLSLQSGLGECFASVSAEDPDLDISAIEACYLNVKFHDALVKRGYPPTTKVYYLTRNTVKNWKQGLSLSHCIFMNLDGKQVTQYNLPSALGYNLSPIHDAVVGNYPSYATAMNILSDGESEMGLAISRDIALFKTKVGVVFVYYRTDAVGWIQPGTNKLNLVDGDLGWVASRYLSSLDIG